MTTTLITQAMLERRVGTKTVAQYCNDTGATVADATIVGEILDEAVDVSVGLLGPGFTPAQVDLLAANDAGVRGAMLDIAADLMGHRRPALIGPDGKSPWGGWRTKAEDVLERAGQAQRRLKGEFVTGGAGPNALAHVTTSLDPPALQFAPTRDSPRGTGGF